MFSFARISLFVVLTILLAACGKYNFREVPDGIGGRTTLFYAYGNYCGGGYPPNLGKKGTDGKIRTLASVFPPRDDLDSLCYAHDQCYEMDANRVTCDSALHQMTIDLQSDLKGKGCWNTTTDLTIAFFGKFWERGATGSETMANRLVGTTLGVPIAMFWAVVKFPIRPFIAQAKEGDCNLAEQRNESEIFQRFESEYSDGLFNDEHKKIQILPPEKASASE